MLLSWFEWVISLTLLLGIDMGTRVGIIGPNGAGKSTLMVGSGTHRHAY